MREWKKNWGKRKSFGRDIKTIKEAKQNRQTRAFVNDCKERRKYNRDRMRVEDEGRGSFVNRLKLNWSDSTDFSYQPLTSNGL
jgi:hypothetical protein